MNAYYASIIINLIWASTLLIVVCMFLGSLSKEKDNKSEADNG